MSTPSTPAGHPGDEAGATSGAGSRSALGLDRHSVVAREEEQSGGVEVGSAFFGWLTATGTAVLLTALLTAAGTAVGLATGTTAGEAVQQGVAVWLWAVVVAVLVAVLTAVAGDQDNVLSRLNSFPRPPVGEGRLTTGAVIAVVAAAVVSLVGAILGGLAGMRFHREVGRAGLGR